MRFNHILFKIFRYFGVLLLCICVTGALSAQVKPGKKTLTISASLKVVDENGTPVQKAKVVIGEGITHAMTDANGAITFTAYPDDVVTISAPGYEKTVATVQDLLKENSVKLVKAKLFMTSDDNVPLPYMTVKKAKYHRQRGCNHGSSA